METRVCREDERLDSIDVINKVFREDLGFEKTMQKEFQVLLGEDNVNNMIIGKIDNKIVSSANYYHNTLLIKGFPLKVSSLGAVCTYKEFRRRGLTSKMLKLGDRLCKNNGSTLLIVSGVLPIYQRHGAIHVSNLKRYYIEGSLDINYTLEKYKEEDFQDVVRLYNNEGTKFVREYREFNNLLKGSTESWGNKESILFIIKNKGIKKAYLLIEIDKKNNNGKVKEWAGERSAIASGMDILKLELKLNELYIEISKADLLNEELLSKEIEAIEVKQWVSLKILNCEKFFESIRPYLNCYYGKSLISKIEIKNTDYGVCIKSEGYDDINISSKEFTEIVFENNIENIKTNEIIREIFPIEFINIYGMNYQ